MVKVNYYEILKEITYKPIQVRAELVRGFQNASSSVWA